MTRSSERIPGAAALAFGSLLAVAPIASAAGIGYSTYLGGAGNEGDGFLGDGHVGLAVDAAGNRYVTGTTRSADFPTTPGADGTLDGGADLFVTKLGPAGDVVYSTYLGGPCEDFARDIAVDAAGNAYVTGRAGTDCPFGGVSGVLVAKLAPDGALVWSSIFGGRLADTSVGEAVAVDAQGHAYVAGIANTSSHDFPTTPGAFRTEQCANGYWFAGDAFVAKLDPAGTRLVYSTLVCGSGDDAPRDIAVDASGTAYVAGVTASKDFPTAAALQATSRVGPVGVTGFVFALAPDGATLEYSTYLGGSTSDAVVGLALDGQRNVYVTGETQSQDFPTTAGVIQETAGNRLCIQTCSDAFVTKIVAGGGALAFSTYLHGEGDDAGTGVAVDPAGHVWVVGTTASRYFPIARAFQPTNRGLTDVVVAKLAPDATRLLFASHLGASRTGSGVGEGWDEGMALALDGAGDVHVAGYTQSYDFPTTPDAAQPQHGGGICDYVGTPCGDAFVTTIAADAAGPVPPVALSATPADIAPGGSLQVAWSGIPVPTASDHLRVCSLGSPGGSACEVTAWWPTGGTAAGELLVTVPADVAPGWYDVRLLNPDASLYGLLVPVGRSSPIRVSPVGATTTTTTVPPTTLLPPGCPEAPCDPGDDPCVVETCEPGGGCVPAPRTGLASVTCTCERPDPPACAGQQVPAGIGRRRSRACRLLTAAAATTSRSAATRRLRKAARIFPGILVAVGRARARETVSEGCAGALAAAVADARDRATRLLTRTAWPARP